MNAEVYSLLPQESCYSKTHGNDFLESYNSHVNLCLAFVAPVLKELKYNGSINDISAMVRYHDIGKLNHEFQEMLLNGRRTPQYIHHSELAFIKWLNKDEGIKELQLPYILAILAHHRTLIDDDAAIYIERYISNHKNWAELSREWLNIIKRPSNGRIDREFFLALPLIDILRTVDILASYTSETIYKQFTKKSDISPSLYDAGITDVSTELSCINVRSDELSYEIISDDKKLVKIRLVSPVESIIELQRRGTQ